MAKWRSFFLNGRVERVNQWIFFERLGLNGWTVGAKRNDKHYSVTHALQLSSAEQIFTQKFESPGFPIEYQKNWKVNAFSRGI